MIPVTEIFTSIDGEINPFGHGVAVFVRVHKCNLSCNWCFGIVPGRRIPKLTYSRKTNKRINEVAIGDKLMTYDENTNKPVETEVINVFKRTVDEWLKIKIEGTLYFVTKEHPFFTSRGLVRADELKIGDQILHSSYNQKISFQKTLDNPMKREDVALKSTQNTDYIAQGKKISKIIQSKKNKGDYVPVWYTLSEQEQQEMKKKISKANKGKNNGNWKGGKHKNYLHLKKKIKNGKITQCSICGKKIESIHLIKQSKGKGIGLDVHYIDGNQKNDKMNNLQVVCESCHYSIHKIGYNFWKSKRKDNKILKPNNGFTVEKIEYINRFNKPPSLRRKPLEVWNFQCHPYNSYIIDNMWVHNCDTVVKEYKMMEVHEIVEHIKSFENIKKVTITGGEPLLYKEEISKLIFKLRREDFKISIETNGTQPLLRYNEVSHIVDYKLPSSGCEHAMDLNIYETFSNKLDYVKFCIMDKHDYKRACAIALELQTDYEIFGSRIAFSPIFEANNSSIKKDLAKWMIEDQLPYKYNLQIHKIIGLR